ncbi:hypothetical protein ZWY2020_028815 [Hordeum vulgare]|nr:hypothetical protein ZWY2020_028815 [Hordeum vulgare]
MGDHEARGDDTERKADKKLSGWGLFGSKYEDAADLYDKAANFFKLSKNWNRAASVYIKIANCHLKGDSKHEAASAYVEAANCYKKFSPQEAAQALDEAVNLFEIGRLSMAARYCKYSVRGILLNAGICQLCRADTVAIQNSLERYQEIDPTFSGTREYKLLAEFDGMTRLDPWKTTLLLRAKNELKKQEDDEDDLT